MSTAELADLYAWLDEKWNYWKLPRVYLEVAVITGWRAYEIASMREEDLLPDGYVRVAAESCKTRRFKIGWLPAELYSRVQACCQDGWAFGRFADELKRLILLWKRQPHHAARVRVFGPRRLVGWMQKELERYHDDREKAAKEKGQTWDRFSLHDFRRTAITGMQMAGVSEKEASIMVGATPEVIRKHYSKLDQMAISRRNVERRIGAEGPATVSMPHSLRAGCAQAVDQPVELPQTVTA